MTVWRLWRLFHRPGQGTQRGTSLLSVIAFAGASAIFLTVLGGVHGFVWRASPDHSLGCMMHMAQCGVHGAESSISYDVFYVLLAIFACLLLAVPFTALAGSAARLAASRRDSRLAALRLIGATNSQVMRLTALEATGQALVGALLGVVGYVALMPAVELLRFQNRHFTVQELWVGFGAIAAVCVGVMLLALVSALVALRGVAITPLGVMQRTARPLPTIWRLVVFAVAMLAAVVVFRSRAVMSHLDVMRQGLVIITMIVVCFLLVNLVGTWAISVRARRKVRHPKDAATMIAMRRILDNPKRAWRNVSGIALAVFIAGITSITGYFGSAAGTSQSSGGADVVLLKDIGTGGLLTLAFASVLAAVSCGVMQAGNVYDQENEYRILMLEGTDMTTMNRARFIEVLTPLNVVVVIAAGCSMVLMLPLMAAAMMNVTTLLYFAGGIGLCYGLVSIGVFAANRVAGGLELLRYRTDD